MKNKLTKDINSIVNKLGKVSLFCGIFSVLTPLTIFNMPVEFRNIIGLDNDIVFGLFMFIWFVLCITSIICGFMSKSSKKIAPFIGFILGIISLVYLIFCGLFLWLWFMKDSDIKNFSFLLKLMI